MPSTSPTAGTTWVCSTSSRATWRRPRRPTGGRSPWTTSRSARRRTSPCCSRGRARAQRPSAFCARSSPRTRRRLRSPTRSACCSRRPAGSTKRRPSSRAPPPECRATPAPPTTPASRSRRPDAPPRPRRCCAARSRSSPSGYDLLFALADFLLRQGGPRRVDEVAAIAARMSAIDPSRPEAGQLRAVHWRYPLARVVTGRRGLHHRSVALQGRILAIAPASASWATSMSWAPWARSQ